MALVLALAAAAILLRAGFFGTTTNRATTACAPAPCAEDQHGLAVFVSAVNRDVTGPGVDAPPGTAAVQVIVRFTNHATDEEAASPLDFILQDGRGAHHQLLLRVGSACGLFNARSLPAGASEGPEVMCFAVGRPVVDPLTLLWSPLSAAPITIQLGGQR